jgi:hypothetical protein
MISKADRQNTSTPPSLCRWIYERLVEADVHPQTILDPCAGDGNLTTPFRPHARVIEYEIQRGTNFFDAKRLITCDLAICNPPWKETERWLRHLVWVVGHRTPIVFMCPLLFFGGYKTAPCRQYLESTEGPILNSITVLPQDTFVGVYSSSVIFWLNLPEIRNVAFVAGVYLIRSNNLLLNNSSEPLNLLMNAEEPLK